MEAALPGLGLEELHDAAKHPRMYHLPLFEAPNGLAEALITGRERMFVEHFMRQQSYHPDRLDQDVIDEYARCLAARGALRGGIGYFRAHLVDAEHNRENARKNLSMPVMTMGGNASFGANLKEQFEPLVKAPRRDDRGVRALSCRGAAHACSGRTAPLLYAKHSLTKPSIAEQHR